MKTVPTNSSVVITAQDVNLSIFKPFWLIKVGIFQESELSGNVIITPVIVQIPCKTFELSVLPNRIQFLMNKTYPEAQTDIIRIIGGIVRTLPHTPYTGVGLNFDYLVFPDDKDTYDVWNKKLFGSLSTTKIESNQKEARYGSYISYNILDARLKIDIKPIKDPSNLPVADGSLRVHQEEMKVNINFHYEVVQKSNPVEPILGAISKWNEATALADKICRTITD